VAEYSKWAYNVYREDIFLANPIIVFFLFWAIIIIFSFIPEDLSGWWAAHSPPLIICPSGHPSEISISLARLKPTVVGH